MFDQSCALESLERQLIDRKRLYLLRDLIALLVMSDLLSDSGVEAVDQPKGHYSYQRCNNIDNNANLQWVFRKERVGKVPVVIFSAMLNPQTIPYREDSCSKGYTIF